MFENEDLALGDTSNNADKYDHDNDNDNGRTRRLNSKHEKDGDNHKRRQRRESKHRRSDSQVDNNRTGTTTGSTKDSTSSDTSDDDTKEKRRKRRHSKKRKHRRSDGRRRRNEDDDDDDDSHSRRKKSKKKSKKKVKTVKLRTISSRKEDGEPSSHTNHPVDNNNTQRNEQQAISTNQMIPLPESADRPKERFNDEPVLRMKPNMIPMTRQEYEQEQAQIRSIYDPESGRIRLVRGSGEIIESIVSRSQHNVINQIATQTDGQSYTKHVFANAVTSRKR